MIELKIGAAEKGLDWLQWSASITASLAWPVAAVAIACIFRSQISSLVAKVRKLSWGDKAVDFADKLDKIESREVAALPADEPEPRLPLPDRFQQLVAISPSAAILDAWGPVETKVREIAYRIINTGNIEATGSALRSRPIRATMAALRNAELISPGVYEMLHDLQSLRNAAAHQQEVTPTDAIRFQALAQKVMRELEKQ